MKRKIRLLALDLDGTTLNSDGRLSVFNRRMFQDAHEMGMHIIVASGRAFTSLPDEVLSLPYIEYAITSNGAVIYDVIGRKRMQSYYLKKEAVRNLLRIAKEADVMVEGFVEGVPYSQYDYVENPVRFGASLHSVEYVKRTRQPVEDIFSFLLTYEEKLDSLDLITDNIKKKAELSDRIKNEVGDIYLTSSIPMLLEVSDSHAGKASGLQFLAEFLNIQKQEIVAFGNAENDLDMMAWAGLGVAVANSPKDVCALADEVTESNDEDGVGRWIWRYLKKSNV